MRLFTTLSLAFLLSAATLCAAQNGNAYGKNKQQGKKTGTYALKIVGQYSGEGTGIIYYPSQSNGNGRGRGRGRGNTTPSTDSISITATIKSPSGAVGTVTFPTMLLEDDRFRGSATFNGAKIDISGRVDMPANTDAEQTSTQKITGRISALLTDSTGHGARLVAVEDESSRALITVP